MTFTFDYHKEENHSFLGWMLVNLCAGLSQDEELWKKLTKETDGFTNVELTMKINGIDVPVELFIDRLEDNMQRFAETAAAEKLEAVSGITDIEEELDGLRYVLRERKHRIADMYGIALD